MDFFSDTKANLLSGFAFICISFACLGQEDEEVKVNEFSEIYKRLAQKHGRELLWNMDQASRITHHGSQEQPYLK